MDIPTELLRRLDEAVRTGHQELRDSFFDWLLIFTGVVGVGVLLEIVEFLELVGVLSEGEQSAEKSAQLSWIKMIPWVGWLLILVGVGGEGVFEGLTARADNTLQTFENIILLSTEQDVTAANNRSATAIRQGQSLAMLLKEEQQTTKRFQQQATLAEQTLKKEVDSVDVNVKRRGPRFLLLAGLGLDARLRPFRNQHLYVFSCDLVTRDTENAETLGALYNELMFNAHWSVIPRLLDCRRDLPNFDISILVDPKASNTTRSAANALASAIHDALLLPDKSGPEVEVVGFPDSVLNDRPAPLREDTVLVRVDKPAPR